MKVYAVIGGGTPSYDEGDTDVWVYRASKQIYTHRADALKALDEFCEGEKAELKAQGATERHWHKESDTEWVCRRSGDPVERVQVEEFELGDE